MKKAGAAAARPSAENNIAYIDGQNLHNGIKGRWVLDYKRFRVYLRENYGVTEAYYHFGYVKEKFNDIYTNLQKAGFIVVFKDLAPHSAKKLSPKKGNVDTDLVFEIMKKLYKYPDSFNKIVLVSGDGDFFNIVKFLIDEGRFRKILFPRPGCVSSLYKKIGAEYGGSLENALPLIQYKKR